jgi:hypothetical protein
MLDQCFGDAIHIFVRTFTTQTIDAKQRDAGVWVGVITLWIDPIYGWTGRTVTATVIGPKFQPGQCTPVTARIQLREQLLDSQSNRCGSLTFRELLVPASFGQGNGRTAPVH